MGSHSNTAAVLGLDALSKQLLLKALEEGYMPYFSSISGSDRVIIKNLRCVPPLTASSWPTIMSGVNPGKHGIFSFYRLNREYKRLDLYNTLWLEHPRIHEMVSFSGRRVKSFVFNPIPEKPIIPVKDSTIVSNMFFSGGLIYYPKNINKRILSVILDGQKYVSQYYKASGCESVKVISDLYNNYIIPLAEEVVDQGYDLIWFNLDMPDHILHKCQDILTSNRIDLLSEFFREVDRIIKLFVENYDIKIVVSDHGFDKFEKMVSINDILVKNGLGTITRQPLFDFITKKEEHDNIVWVNPKLIRMLEKLRIKPVAKKIFRFFKKDAFVISSMFLDPFNSDAYYLRRTYGIYFNNKDSIAKTLDVLSSYTDYLTYYPSKEVYSGDYVHLGPDIVVLPKDGVNFGSLEIYGSDVISKTGADHHLYGVFVAIDSGLDIDSVGSEIVPNYIVAPLVMCRMGIPVPHDSDANNILEALGLKCDKANYIGKWKIAKRIFVKMKMK